MSRLAGPPARAPGRATLAGLGGDSLLLKAAACCTGLLLLARGVAAQGGYSGTAEGRPLGANVRWEMVEVAGSVAGHTTLQLVAHFDEIQEVGDVYAM